MIPRPPRSTRTYTLFPYTTRVRTPAGRSAANNIRQSLAAHSKRCLRRFANPLLQRTKARSTAGRECEDQSIDGPGVVPDDLVRALPLVNLEDDGKQSAHHQRRSEEHTSELLSLMRISYAVFWLKNINKKMNERQDNDT